MTPLDDKREKLLDLLRSYGSCAVAYSGGVDSAVVAKAAQLALGDRAVAVTGTSYSLADGELSAARHLAELIGIRHQVLETREFENPNYVRNSADRCYHCKTELYTRLDDHLADLEVDVIVNGANADDLGDYRPGMQAANEHKVRSPLADCGLTKSEVRQLAAEWTLPVWDKPATPCLSSRVAYGEEVTPERLAMIDAAERFLREHGLVELRVRYHKGDVARIEIRLGELARFADSPLRDQLVQYFKSVGFKYVTIDLEGFRSGSMNEVLPVSQIKLIS
jgi:uncharacterized protein